MAEDNYRKMKLLKLMELLRQETDEQHPMTKAEVCRRLCKMGINCDVRTLGRDVRVLRDQGYEIMEVMISHDKAYYIADRSFSVPELKILIDAVQAASFVTDKKTGELIDKIATLGGSHRAGILKGNIVMFNTRKHTNETIYYTVGFIEDAIQRNKKIIFKYFDLDENRQKVYRRDGHHYVVEPVALVFNEDNYYLVVYSSRHDGTANYRVDRMEVVEIIDEEITEVAKQMRDSLAAMTESSFKMYGGQPVKVVLEFDDKLIGVVYDKFGEDTTMRRTGEHTCMAAVTVQISPTFFGWLFQFGDKMTIISPTSLKEEYTKQAAALLNI